MNVNLLIDAIVRQTMILVAQLATTAGVRAPLAHVTNQVFISLVEGLESQGVGRKVIADMFGLALRSYQIKVRRLAGSDLGPNRTLWEVVLNYIRDHKVVSRSQLLSRFHREDETSVRGILNDLVETGFVFKSGRTHTTMYRAASDEEMGHAAALAPDLAALPVVWIAVYRGGPVSRRELGAQLPIESAILNETLDLLVTDGRVSRAGEGDDAEYSCQTCVMPVGESLGWEAAVFDHYQAMVMALCAKLEGGRASSLPSDVTGGSTYSFDVWDGHPSEDRVLGILREIRAQVSQLREEVTAYNEEHGRPEEGSHKVVFYAGQMVVAAGAAEGEEVE
jgi:hypothetical protein